MKYMEFDPPAGGWTLDLPAWLLIPLALMWCWFVWKQPRNDSAQGDGWYVPPTILTVVAVIGAVWLT